MSKKNDIELILYKIEQAYNNSNIIQINDINKCKIKTISSGSIGLDIALGIGGYPRGKIIEIFGPESSGKTTLGLHAIAECQKNQGTCAFIDVEYAFDKSYAKNLGVNLDELVLSQPDFGEQALEIIDILTKTKAFDLIVIDSVAALVPKVEIEGNMGDNHIGVHAKLMSQALRKLTLNITKSKRTERHISMERSVSMVILRYQ